MKKLFLICHLVIISAPGRAQILKGSYGIRVFANEAKLDTAFINTRYTRVLKNLEDLKSMSLPITNGTVINVQGFRTAGDGGGGNYSWCDTCTAQDDGGGIIAIYNTTAKGRFIHEVLNGIVNLKWWGIRAYEYKDTRNYDISSAFNAAQRFLKRDPEWTSLYIPADTTGATGAYYCKRTLTIYNSIKIYGDKLTRIEWPSYTTCISIPFKDESGNNRKTMISDLEIFQAFTRTYGDSSAHGISSRSLVILNNIFVSFVSGDAFHLEACEKRGHDIEGSVDFSEINNCIATQSNNGLYINGCDANKINIYKFNAKAIRRWGVYDNGFLGNTYSSPHFAFCGSGTNSDVVVTFKEQYYAAISEYGFVNQGFRPDQFPQYWQPVSSMGKGPEWIATKKYYSGGPYRIRNDNAATTIIDPYFEGFQPNAFNSIHTLSLNGTRGVTIIGGADMHVTNGGLALNTSLEITGLHNGLHINQPTTIAAYPALALRSHDSFSTIFHESTLPGVYERYKNADNDKGYFSYKGTSFLIEPDQSASLEITPVTIKLLKAVESTNIKDKMLVIDPDTKEVKYTSLTATFPRFIFGEEFTGSTSAKLTLTHNAIEGSLRLFKNGLRLTTTEFMYKGGSTIILSKPKGVMDIITADYYY